jgi:hypothetical protein
MSKKLLISIIRYLCELINNNLIMNQKINRIRQILVVLVFIALGAGFTSCEKYSYLPPLVDPNAVYSFSADIQPIFTSNCVACHGGAQAPNLSAGKSYLALTKGGFVNLPAANSRLYVQMTSAGHASRSTAADKLKVLYWITQGALNN